MARTEASTADGRGVTMDRLPGQASLFDEIPAPRARRTDPRTSHLAAQSMVERANTHRARILEALAEGPLTGDELDQRFGWRAATACRRLKELVDAGLIERCQELRFTSAGRPAHLYRRTIQPKE